MPNNVAFNTVQNMGEDLTFLVGYSLFNKFMHEKFADLVGVEEGEMNIAFEVLSGGASYLFSSAMMEVIRREEAFIRYVFAAGEAVIAVLYMRNKGWIDSMKSKILPKRGVLASAKFKALQGQNDPSNNFINQVYHAMQNIISGRNSTDSIAQTIGAGTQQQEHGLNRERQNLEFAKANNEAFHRSILIKTLTGTFTDLDEQILKKVVGRDNFQTTQIDHNELNAVRDFMFVKDSNGKFLGLTKGFMELLNGLGYLHKTGV